MKKDILFSIIGFCFICFVFSTIGTAKEKPRIITPGDFFPEFSFPMPLGKQDEEYLGFPQKFLGWGKKDTFSLKEIKGDLIVLEYLNKYCFSCQLQAPIMNQVFAKVTSDPRLKDRVKFLGVGAGNNQHEVESFRQEKKIPFPIVPDPKFLAYEAIGDPGATPFTLFIRKTEAGLIVAQVKVGLTKEPEKILNEIEQALLTDWNVLLKQKKDTSLEQAKEKKLFLPYTEGEILKKVQEAMLRPEWKVLKVTKIDLGDGEGLF
ncbi:MAG: TlpA family protein disulfide reductase, partial [bacterium]